MYNCFHLNLLLWGVLLSVAAIKKAFLIVLLIGIWTMLFTVPEPPPLVKPNPVTPPYNILE